MDADYPVDGCVLAKYYAVSGLRSMQDSRRRSEMCIYNPGYHA